jgi:hypothetical protein
MQPAISLDQSKTRISLPARRRKSMMKAPAVKAALATA